MGEIWQGAERLLGLLGLLRQEHRVDVREDTAGRDGDAREELVELLVVAHGELHVARHLRGDGPVRRRVDGVKGSRRFEGYRTQR